MQLPYYIHLFGWRIHPHPFFESLAYLVAARLFFFLRKKDASTAMPLDLSLWLFSACLAGAMAGSKLLAWAESPTSFFTANGEFNGFENGKTIVGGILGAWLGVDAVKRALNVRENTGDAFVFPLIVGMSIGRVGCFLTGLSDRTHGLPCAMPWCVNFGDGIPRHPTQLYEIAFLLLYGACLLWRMRKPYPPGYLFRLFVFAYMSYRFCIEFIRPRDMLFLGLSPIQLGALAGATWAYFSLRELMAVKMKTDN